MSKLDDSFKFWDSLSATRDALDRQSIDLQKSGDTLRQQREASVQAQLQTAEELKRLREDLERIERKQDENQKEQAKDTEKAYNVSLVALGLNALAIIVAVIIALLS